jgi:hypothetical protein
MNTNATRGGLESEINVTPLVDVVSAETLGIVFDDLEPAGG